MWTRSSAAVLCALLLGSHLFAQDAGNGVLATAKTLKCTFRVMATGIWSDGTAQAGVKKTELNVVFNSINTEEGTAGIVGQFGKSEIIAKLNNGILHLIESFRDGALYITTVFNREIRPGVLRAVHTRHEYTDVTVPGFTSSPEQYYGECVVEQ